MKTKLKRKPAVSPDAACSRVPLPLDCPHCGAPGVLHTDCPHPVCYCRRCCLESERYPREYRDTPRAAVQAWNSHVREIRSLQSS